jgi:hypothetical protein
LLGLLGTLDALDLQPSSIEQSACTGQLKREEALDGLLQRSGTFGPEFAWSLLPSSLESFEATAKLVTVRCTLTQTDMGAEKQGKS